MPNCIEYLGTTSDGLRGNKLLPSGEHAALCNRRVGRDSQQNVQQVARLPQAENTQHCATAVLKETASLTAPSGEHAALCSCNVAKDSKLPTKPRSRVVAGGTKKLLEHNLASILSVNHAFIQDNESCVMQGTQICRKILHFEKLRQETFLKFWLHKWPPQPHPPPPGLKALGHTCGRAQCACPSP